MPRFAYAATTRDGGRSSGVQKADSRAAAELALYDRELRDIQVTEKKSLLQLEISGPRVKRDDLMHLSRQMAAFIRAGLPIIDAVHTIGEESENSSIRRMMNDVEDGLRSGERGSAGVGRHRRVWRALCGGVGGWAGVGGGVGGVLWRLAVYL